MSGETVLLRWLAAVAVLSLLVVACGSPSGSATTTTGSPADSSTVADQSTLETVRPSSSSQPTNPPISASTTSGSTTKKRRDRTTESDEFRAMPGFRIHLASASIVLKYDSPTDGTSLTILVFTKTNTVYPGWLQQQLTKSGLDPELGFLFVEEVATIVGASVHSELPDSWTNAISIDELEPHYSRVRDAILRFVTSLQPSGHSEAT